MARRHPLGIRPPQAPHLDQGRDPLAGEYLVGVVAIGRLIVGQGLDPIRGQVRLALLQDHRQRLAVAGLGVGDLVGQHHLMFHIHQQVELEPEPLDHLGHLPLGVLVFLAATAGLRRPLVDLLLGGLLVLAPRRQAGGVTGGVLAQVGDRQSQALDRHIEDLFEERAMGLLAEHLLEPRDVPGLGHAGFRLDADEPA